MGDVVYPTSPCLYYGQNMLTNQIYECTIFFSNYKLKGMIKMEIRRANNNDLDGINKLLKQVLDVHHQGRPDIFKANAKKYTDDELKDIISDNSRPIFVAYENDTVMGYAFCVFEQHINNNILTDVKSLYIDDLCVDETLRGKNIGKSLYEYVLNFAKENDCYNVTLNVWACNEKALGFYQKMGLVPQKIHMEKIL